MADLAQFDTVTKANEGVDVQLKLLATGKPSGVFFTVLGKDSDEFRSVLAERSRFISDRIAAGNTAQLSSEERDEMECDTFARCTKGWKGLTEKGEPVPFSRDKARDIYRRYPEIREQVNVFIGDRANFLLA